VLAAVPRSTESDDIAHAVVHRDELEDAFMRLTPERRAVVVMHHYLGYSLTEIARTLAIPEGTARSRLHFAVRQLRAVLDVDSASLVATEERSA
jgi:RNA polymerase sigma-70 factor (ECF subfamily)